MSRHFVPDPRPDDASGAARVWERWVEGVRVFDMVRVAGRSGVLTSIEDDFAWVRLDGRTDAEPFEWHLLGAYP